MTTPDLRKALEPCPFCGGEATSGYMGDEDGGYGFVECSLSSLDGHFAGAHEDTEEEAIEAWNTRALAHDLNGGWQPIETAPKDGLIEQLQSLSDIGHNPRCAVYLNAAHATVIDAAISVLTAAAEDGGQPRPRPITPLDVREALAFARSPGGTHDAMKAADWFNNRLRRNAPPPPQTISPDKGEG